MGSRSQPGFQKILLGWTSLFWITLGYQMAAAGEPEQPSSAPASSCASAISTALSRSYPARAFQERYSDIQALLDVDRLVTFIHDNTKLLPSGRLPWTTKEEKEAAILSKEAALNIIRVRQKEMIEPDPNDPISMWAHQIRNAYNKTIDDLYQGNNAALQSLWFLELPRTRPQLYKPIDYFITTDRYESQSWWVDSREVAHITSRTSRSLLKRLVGDDAYRVTYWPKENDIRGDRNTAIDKLRIAVNYTSDHQPHSVEVFARDKSGNWLPFYYERIGNQWFPTQMIRIGGQEKRVRELCSSCHMASGVFSPRPIQMKTFEDFVREGYHEPGIIHHLLDERNWKNEK